MPTTEHTINDALAELIRTTRRAWRESDVVRAENSGMLRGSNKRPDLLILEANVSPVAVETEVFPAATLESDAAARLGEHIRTTGRQILSCVTVRLPSRLTTLQASALTNELARADDLEMCIYTGAAPPEAVRWPQAGWVRGKIADLSVMIQSAAIPEAVINKAADELVEGVKNAAALIEDMAQAHPAAIHKISDLLRQEDGEQTRKMACTILANAFVFQGSLAGGPGELASVPSLDELQGRAGGLSKSQVLDEWRKILKINYWPIFDIARRILEVIPNDQSKPLIDRMAKTAEKLLENRLMRSHDLTGAVFQKLIADRKFLAAYYTSPSSAALLVGLAISASHTPTGNSWASAKDVTISRVADFACGTGTLLSSAYQRIGQLHELAGGDSEAIHPQMMARALVGCDILPAAAHLTASMLSGAHPTVKYTDSSILTLGYGEQSDGEIRLGSLDLLDEQGRVEVLAITAKALGGKGEKERETWWSLKGGAFDLVIMNPPFTRATGHEANKIGVPNPMFAAFSATDQVQRSMSKATQALTKGTSAHGNAGEASIFLVLANRKLAAGGTIALVMPLSLLLGDAWEPSRALLSKNYSNLIFVSIAGAGDEDSSFSADTGMAECLVVGQKRRTKNNRAVFVVLHERPRTSMLGASVATQVSELVAGKRLRRIEDGPVGGTPLYFGDTTVGHAMDAPVPASGPWNIARIADLSLAQAAYQLEHEGRIWLPAMNKSEAIDIPICKLKDIAVNIGPYHADINGRTSDGGVRGPFDIHPLRPGTVPTHPALWSHDAKNQQSLSFPADSEAIPKSSLKEKEREVIAAKIESVWRHASHCHFNRDFRFNSQPTAMQFTPRRSLGGSAWIAIRLKSSDFEKTLVLWANSSLGMLLHWWHANKQQSGRGRIGVSPLESLPTLCITNLSKAQIKRAAKVFDSLCNASLLPIHLIDSDAVRREIDEKLCKEALDLPPFLVAPGGPLELLRMKLAQEPSIRGTK